MSGERGARIAPALRVAHWIDGVGRLRPPLQLTELGAGFKLLFCFQHACPGCHSVGFPTLRKLVDALSGKGFGFAAVQTVFEEAELNTADRLRDAQLRYGLAIPFGHDPAGDRGPSSLMCDYQTGGTPWFIVIDPTGRLVFSDFSLDADRLIESFARFSADTGTHPT